MSNAPKQLLSKKEKRKLIKSKYDLSKKPVNYKNLSYRNKIYLLAIFRVLTDEGFEIVIPLQDNKNERGLSPTSSMDIEILHCLNTKDIILVNPKSKLKAFCFENNNICNDFNWDIVSWVVNISSDKKNRLRLYECFRTISNELLQSPPRDNHNQIYGFTYTLAFNEVLKYLQYKWEVLGFEYDNRDKTAEIIYQILNDFSVSEIYNFVDQAVEDDFLYYSNIERNKKDYGNLTSIRMLEIAENALLNKTPIPNNKRKDSMPRSALSIVFYDLIHKGKDEGFTESPKDFWINTLADIYKQE